MIAVIDTETTGRSYGMHEIVQVAGVLLDRTRPGLPEVAAFNAYMRPLRPSTASAEALAVNKLTLAGLARERHPAEVLKEFAAFVGSHGPAVLCGHNVVFDLGFLGAAEREHGFTLPRASMAPICTLIMARKILGARTDNHKLSTLAAHYGITFGGPGAHDALADVRVTAELLRRLHAEAPLMFGDAIPPALLAPIAPTLEVAPVAERAAKVTPIRPSTPAPALTIEQEIAQARRELKVARDALGSTAEWLVMIEALEAWKATPLYTEYMDARRNLAMLVEMAGDAGEEVA